MGGEDNGETKYTTLRRGGDMSESCLNYEEQVFADRCEAFSVPKDLLITDHSRTRFIDARRKVARVRPVELATMSDALQPHAAGHLRRFGLSEAKAMQVSREFVRLLTGLLLTRGLVPSGAGITTAEVGAPPEEEVAKCPKTRAFLFLLQALMPDLVALCMMRGDSLTERVADAETVQRLQYDRLAVIARLCRVPIAVGDAGEPTLRQLTDGLLTFRSDTSS